MCNSMLLEGTYARRVCRRSESHAEQSLHRIPGLAQQQVASRAAPLQRLYQSAMDASPRHIWTHEALRGLAARRGQPAPRLRQPCCQMAAAHCHITAQADTPSLCLINSRFNLPRAEASFLHRRPSSVFILCSVLGYHCQARAAGRSQQ